MEVSTLETLMAQNNEILMHIYVALLFVIGCGVASGVVFLLYKFLRKFF